MKKIFLYCALCLNFPVLCVAGGEHEKKEQSLVESFDSTVYYGTVHHGNETLSKAHFEAFVENPLNRTAVRTMRLAEEHLFRQYIPFFSGDFSNLENLSVSGRREEYEYRYEPCWDSKKETLQENCIPVRVKKPGQAELFNIFPIMNTPNLTELSIISCSNIVDIVHALSKMNLRSVRRFRLIGNTSLLENKGDNITKAIKYLCENIRIPNLEELDLGFNFMNSDTMYHISRMDLSKLRCLDLSANEGIGYAGVIHLRKVPLEKLEKLSLSDCNIGSVGVRYLCDLDLTNLKELDLSNNNIGSEGLKFLVGMKLPNLQKLSLGNNRITPEGMKHLSTMELPSLRYLDLSDNHIEEKHIKHLMKAKYISSLEELYLGERDDGSKEGDLGFESFTPNCGKYFSRGNFLKLKKMYDAPLVGFWETPTKDNSLVDFVPDFVSQEASEDTSQKGYFKKCENFGKGSYPSLERR